MDNVIEIKRLGKAYGGRSALLDVGVEIGKGRIVGLLGPNGSGKTTLLKILAGIMQRDRGEIVFDGDFDPLRAKRHIAMMPDAYSFPNWMRVYDGFRYYRDMFEDYDQNLADRMIELLELDPMAKVRNLSKGMQERLLLGMTLSRRARLYLLDEPLGGIDPIGKSKIVDAIIGMELGDAGMLVSTHLLRDIERLFDTVYMIGGGRILFQADCEQMRAESGKTVEQAYLEVFGHG